MLFSSLTFLYAFLPLLLITYFLFSNSKVRKATLILFSLFFYAWGEPIYIFLMLMVVTMNYFFGLIISDAKSDKRKKLILIFGVAFNIVILSIFKYSGLIIRTINYIPFINIKEINLRLPLGISFYIFQAMTYIIDVYRNECRVQEKYSSLLLYITFFPQLVAGPIVKYNEIENELENREVNIDDIFSGFGRFSIGLAKKVLLANNLGKVADILLNVNNFSYLSIWIGMIYYLLQLYFDFSGYSDMAIGLGRVFGFHYLENFNYPYISKSIKEFWRRWHISLSSFFREYVYIPLGGKYHFQYRNILIVWALTGLWHGANWNFCLWGLYFAVILIFENIIIGMKLKILDNMNIIIKSALSHIYTVVLLIIGFILFYFEKFSQIIFAYQNMFLFNNDKVNFIVLSTIRENIIILIISIIVSTPIINKISILSSKMFSEKLIIYIKYFIMIVLFVVSTISIIGDSYNPFLYFRF